MRIVSGGSTKVTPSSGNKNIEKIYEYLYTDANYYLFRKKNKMIKL